MCSDIVGRMAWLPLRILSEIEISSGLALWSSGITVEGPVEVSGSESDVAGDEACGEGSTAGSVFVGVAATENWGRLGGWATGAEAIGGSVSESEESVVCFGVGARWGCFFFFWGFGTRGPKATVFLRVLFHCEG